jgi:hypothetical protein
MRKLSQDAARRPYINVFGAIAAAEGLPSIAGRIAGLLYLSSAPVAFSTLVSELGASRGSISTNTRLLIALGVIERVVSPPKREHSFQVARNGNLRTLEGHVMRNETALSMMTEARLQLPPQPPEVLAKMHGVERLYRIMGAHMKLMADALRDIEN